MRNEPSREVRREPGKRGKVRTQLEGAGVSLCWNWGTSCGSSMCAIGARWLHASLVRQLLAAETELLAPLRAHGYCLGVPVDDYALWQNESEHGGARVLVRPGSRRHSFAHGI